MLQSVNQLSDLTGFDRRTIRKRLESLQSQPGPGNALLFDSKVALRMLFVTASAGEIDPETMSPKERLDHFRAEREKTKLLAEAGELIPRDEYRRDLTAVIKLLAVSLESLPDVLERDAGIDGAAVERCRQVIDGLREELYVRLRDMETPTED